MEITAKTLQGRFLLRPSRALGDVVAGILGRASREKKVPIYAAAVMSNHYHLLARFDDAEHMAEFMCFVNGNLAKEVKRLTGWEHKIWRRRYGAIPVSDEEGAQVGRMRYILAHGVKEGLVKRVTDWPGVHCAEYLMSGEALAGHWYDRTAEYRARHAGKRFGKHDFAEREELIFAKLPCWKEMSDEDYRAAITEMVADVEAEARVAMALSGRRVMGAKRVLRQKPFAKPKKAGQEAKKRPAPLVHAATAEVRKAWIAGYRLFEAAYRAAAERLKKGERDVRFPDGCFPPGLPFVPFPKDDGRGGQGARASPVGGG